MISEILFWEYFNERTLKHLSPDKEALFRHRTDGT